MSSSSPVLYETNNGIATVTLNRPDSLNAMNDALMQGLLDAITRVQDEPEVRVVVLTGAGRGFCSGADLGPVATPDGGASNAADAAGSSAANREDEELGGVFNRAMRALHECPVPTIARINGAAAGGGFGLSMACDIAIASEKAFFVATFGPRLGIVPDLGTTWSLPLRVGRARSLGITLLGDRIEAAQAKDWGIVWDCVPHAELDSAVAAYAQRLGRSSPSAMTRIRQSIDDAINNDFSSQLDLEMRHQVVLIPRNMREGAQAFMEKRDPRFGPERD